MGMPVSWVLTACVNRYGMSLPLSLVKKRRTAQAFSGSSESSSYAHGTRYEDEPCSLECEDSSPNAHQRL